MSWRFQSIHQAHKLRLGTGLHKSIEKRNSNWTDKRSVQSSTSPLLELLGAHSEGTLSFRTGLTGNTAGGTNVAFNTRTTFMQTTFCHTSIKIIVAKKYYIN